MSVKTNNEFIVCGKPDIGPKEEEAVLKVLRSGWLGYGAVSQEFERRFAEHLDVKNAIGVGSATIGLIIALRAMGVGSNDEVITTPLTFCATVNAILAVGAKPVFADVDEHGSIKASEIIMKISSKTKAILPVHLWGVPCDMEAIMSIALTYDLEVIEDCAHAFGMNVPHVTNENIRVYSFYPTKNITSGDGGMIVTNDKNKSNLMRVLASQGLTDGAWSRYADGPVKEYKVQFDGYKGQINDISSAIGLAQLRRWPELKEKRHVRFRAYSEFYGYKPKGTSEHIYEIRVENRKEFRKKLYQKGIGTGVHYNPLHLEPAYKFLGYKLGDFPMAEYIGEQTMTLPLSTTMTEEDIYRVIEAVNKIKGEIE